MPFQGKWRSCHGLIRVLLDIHRGRKPRFAEFAGFSHGMNLGNMNIILSPWLIGAAAGLPLILEPGEHVYCAVGSGT
ncbi:uncharacterized protein BJX67DRAFT_364752 [Aspergillus lucknowensis]|uniref:Uncharacterized protein n=1 Tax=Aspergillus lucknowensis TaxID=176173 RepID=A0ABR4LG67_9EURO